MYNVLVTGGAGYLGSILVQYLLNEPGTHVTVLDNFMHNQTSLNHLCHLHQTLTIIKGDCRDDRLLRDLLKKTDLIIPLAAIVGAPACNADIYAAHSTNYNAVKTLTELKSADQRMIIPTTNSGYGIGTPGKECTEDSPLRPLSLYGRDKVAAEYQVLEHAHGVSLRLATVFGFSPRIRLDLLVNDFVYRAVKDRFVVLFEPHFKRNYIHVRDVARAFIHANNTYEKMRGQAYNVGLSSANLSKLELCEQIKLLLPDFTFPIAEVGTDPDKRDYIVSNAKFEATLWAPHYTLTNGIKELASGYQQFGKGQYANA